MDSPEPQRPFVQCCACARVIPLSAGNGPGDVIVCPFCATRQRLREMRVLVSEPLVEA